MTSQEEQIVQACLLDNLVPSPPFQLAVSQVYQPILSASSFLSNLIILSLLSPLALKLLSLTQSHTVVAVVGGVCSGKSKVIKVAADTLRGQGAGLTLSWIFPGALDEGELFGREVEG